jgi:hypothetical protein
LTAPVGLSPQGGVVVESISPPPMLTWRNPADCDPEAYRVELRTVADSWSGEVGGDALGWTPSTLEAQTHYYWSVVPVSGSTEGPESETAWFVTGPACPEGGTPGYAVPPRLTDPADGAVIDTLSEFHTSDGETVPGIVVDLYWEDDSNCVPLEGYRVEVSSVPGFPADARTNSWVVESGLHAVWFIPPGVEWDECQRYFWRVTGLMPEPEADQTSEVSTFIINTEDLLCLAVELEPRIPELALGDGRAAIAGHVWHDECAVPDTSPNAVPPGCMAMDEGGLEGNGVLDPGEGGIQGVTVHLGVGACPTTSVASDTTDAAGQFAFHGLLAGSYCVWADALEPGNDSVLIPGGWTFPERGADLASIEVSLDDDSAIRRDLLLGWDYQYLPLPCAAATGEGETPTLTTMQNADCRSGPSTTYSTSTVIDMGDTLPIQGTNTDSSWWLVVPEEGGVECWVWGGAVRTSGPLGTVEIETGSPGPTKPPQQGGDGCWIINEQQLQICMAPCPSPILSQGPCTP